MALSWPTKDPQEVLDYQLTWLLRLGTSDTIVSSTWARSGSDSLLIIDSSSFTDTVSTVWLSGGTLGVRYTVENTIVTALGRTMQQSCFLKLATR